MGEGFGLGIGGREPRSALRGCSSLCSTGCQSDGEVGLSWVSASDSFSNHSASFALSWVAFAVSPSTPCNQPGRSDSIEAVAGSSVQLEAGATAGFCSVDLLFQSSSNFLSCESTSLSHSGRSPGVDVAEGVITGFLSKPLTQLARYLPE